jgi:hypothetical protein
MDLWADPAEDRRQAYLLPRQPQRTGVRRHGSDVGMSGQVLPSPAVPTTGQEGQIEIVTDAEMADQFGNVPACSRRPGRNGADVEGHPSAHAPSYRIRAAST